MFLKFLFFSRNEPPNPAEYSSERPEMTSHDGKSRKATRKTNQLKEQKVKSLAFFKPTLATMLAIVLVWLVSVRPAQAGGYTVTLQQVGPNVVATGSGAINLTGLTFSQSTSLDPGIHPSFGSGPIFQGCSISTGPTSSSVDSYIGGPGGPISFGSKNFIFPSISGSGDMVGISVAPFWFEGFHLSVPKGYVSGTALSDMAIYSGETFATLGVAPGTYVWKWGNGANQNFTLQIEPPVTTNISNFSTRASVQTGPGVTIAGFIITGTGPKLVVVRGLGFTLAQPPFNVPGVLADPTLQLFDSGGHPFWFNDNWKDTQQAQIQSTGLAAPNDLESAILQTLEPGNYTAVLSGKNGTTGVGLVEVYDTNPGGSAELTNVSTRGFVGTGNDVLIAGFVTDGGNGSTQVVVRGLGPTLAQPQFGVSGALADPWVTLVDSNGNVVYTNNNWKNTQQAAIQATGKAPPNELESALIVTVAPGNYTAILSGIDFGTGIGLLEIYK
jgi:hypothetical protein